MYFAFILNKLSPNLLFQKASICYFLMWLANDNIASFTGNPGMMDFGIGGGHHHHRTASDTASGSSSSGKPGK